MSRTLTFDISDEVYAALQEMAVKQGRPFEDLALEWLLKHRPAQQRALSEQDRKAAWERLQRHMGAQNLGRPTGADNESIDRDLAREYGDPHKDQECS